MTVSTTRALALLAALWLPVAAAAQRPRPAEPRPGFDVLDYDIQLTLPDSGRRIDAIAALTVERRAGGSDTLALDLLGLTVSRVRLGRVATTTWLRDSAGLLIALPARNAPVDTIRIVIEYGGEPADGLIVRGEGTPWSAFGDNWPDRARYWIPSVDAPGDKATVTWRLRHPRGRAAVANGQELSRTGRASVWREDRPISTYLMVIAAGNLVRVDLPETRCTPREMGGCLDQDAWVFPAAAPSAAALFAEAERIAGFFAELIAPFPYERLSHVQSATRFGGMENATAIFYAGDAVANGTLRPGLIAHEAAHQWFGDAVTPATFAHLWLSEGFASYLEQLWVERFQGAPAFRAGLARMREEVAASARVTQRPVVDTIERDYMQLLSPNVYQKGAWLLHMLRRQLGDSAFFRGVRGYYAAHRHRTAVSDDLRAALENESGQRLEWFFEQWLRQPGIPSLDVSWRHDAARGRVVLDVTQHGGAWRVPLTFALRERGPVARRATIIVPAEPRATLELPLPFPEPPGALIADPDVDLLATVTVTP